MSLLVERCASTADRLPSRTYYQVLDISPDEQDPQVIEEAALRCSRHVRAYQLVREAEATLRLNEIARALNTLLDPVRRREYDLSLATAPNPAGSQRRPPGERDTRLLPQGKPDPDASDDDELVLVINDGEYSDVKLVYRRRSRWKADPCTG
jgi:curved DNA-binding protein CbpA